MKYENGDEVRKGDRVRLWQNRLGIVVCSIDTQEYDESWTEEDWGYLGSGVVIKTDAGDVLHYTEADEDIELLVRGIGES